MATDIIPHTSPLQPRLGEPPVPGAKLKSGDDEAQQMISWLAQGVPPEIVVFSAAVDRPARAHG